MSLNGTGTKALLDQQTAVLRALRQAREAMVEAVPNARDYCHLPDPNKAYSFAMAEWRRDISAVEALMENTGAARNNIRANGYR